MSLNFPPFPPAITDGRAARYVLRPTLRSADNHLQRLTRTLNPMSVAEALSKFDSVWRATRLRFVSSLLLVVAVFPLSGCLFRTRTRERQLSTAPLQGATQQQLIDYVNSQASRVQSMQATVDINTSVGDQKSGKITDYKEIRGYVLARKPAMLRMKGLLPVVRNTAFDMVSDGQNFKVWIPPRNKFVTGRNSDGGFQPEKRLENLRPQAIYDALLPREIGPDEIAVLENGYETVLDAKRHRVEQPDYELAIISKGPNGWVLSRKISFSRTDLRPRRQMFYDQQGNIVTDAKYDKYADNGGVEFPNNIEIERPQEDYDILLTIIKLELNKPLKDEQFALEQPAGAEVVHLGQSPTASVKGADGHSQ
jgi:outer membrane lipoprotein-sorting protein